MPFAGDLADIEPGLVPAVPYFRTCSATTRSGERCGAPAVGETEFCQAHTADEQVKALVTAAR